MGDKAARGKVHCERRPAGRAGGRGESPKKIEKIAMMTPVRNSIANFEMYEIPRYTIKARVPRVMAPRTRLSFVWSSLKVISGNASCDRKRGRQRAESQPSVCVCAERRAQAECLQDAAGKRLVRWCATEPLVGNCDRTMSGCLATGPKT
eukprot:810380-Prorocentrum_minimum.AAC.3